MNRLVRLVAFSAVVTAAHVQAGEVEVVAVRLVQAGAAWEAQVTLRHDDAGWDHYADEWRVVDGADSVLGRRVLYHPHVDEQPFTRALTGLRIPDETNIVYVEAHDNVHGWSPRRMKVDLTRSEGEGYRIDRR